MVLLNFEFDCVCLYVCFSVWLLIWGFVCFLQSALVCGLSIGVGFCFAGVKLEFLCFGSVEFGVFFFSVGVILFIKHCSFVEGRQNYIIFHSVVFEIIFNNVDLLLNSFVPFFFWFRVDECIKRFK